MLGGNSPRKKANRPSPTPLFDATKTDVAFVRFVDKLSELSISPPKSIPSAQEQLNMYLARIYKSGGQVAQNTIRDEACIQVMCLTTSQAKKINFRALSRSHMSRLFSTILDSTHPSICEQRKAFFKALNKRYYFKRSKIILDVFYEALVWATPRSFRDLLDHKAVLPNSMLFQYAKLLIEKFRYQNLFYKLNPEDYEKKKWCDLTTYEKLYFIVWEYSALKKISHRLGLEGFIQLKWQNVPLSHFGVEVDDMFKSIDLEGQIDGRGYLQLQESLLLFQLTYDGKYKEILTSVIEELFSHEVQAHFKFKHKLHDRHNHKYLFGLDGHFTAGYHTVDRRYYEINMGFLSGNSTGIGIYEVQPNQRKTLHSRLTNLQYYHTTKHFHRIPKDCQLRKFGYIKLPGQFSGNCTYESLKGLFLVILFDRLRKELTNKNAAVAALNLYRRFCEFDAKDAIVDYRLHSLCLNRELIANAYRTQPKFLVSQVYDDDKFKFFNLKHPQGNNEVKHKYKKSKLISFC